MKHFVGLVLMRHWLKISSLVFAFQLVAQDIPVGTWRTHFSYRNARILVLTSDKVFCATENGLFSFELASGGRRKLSKIDGLSDVGVSAMAYSAENNVLIIGYRSGLVDLVSESDITTIPTIATSSLEGDKTINAITTANGQAYLATNLGIIVIRLSDETIIENFIQIGEGGSRLEIDEVVLTGNTLLIKSNQGIQSGNINENLLDFNNWTRYPETESFASLIVAGEQSFALDGSALFEFQNDVWVEKAISLPMGATKLFSQNGKLLTASSNEVFELTDQVFEAVASIPGTIVNDLLDVNGSFFIADEEKGLINQRDESLSPDGPLDDTYSNVKIIDNQVHGFHAPSPFSYDGSQKMPFHSFFSEGAWSLRQIDGFDNVSDVAIYNGELYYSSIGDGLYSGAQDLIITDIPASAPTLDTLLTSLFSRTELWVAGFGSEPLHTLNQEGDWTSFRDDQLFTNEILSINLSGVGIAWLGTSSNITVLDRGRELVDQLSTSDGLPESYTDFDISVEDNAWIATGRGPALFPNASFIFENATAILPTFENRVLFEGEEINTVLTDGGNRVWFGTNRGLWAFDENISEQLLLFNESNSPIPSDRVLDLAYNTLNGELFIVTDNGMVSYRTASSIGNIVHHAVSFFPNPVRPDYQGLLGISGLANNVSIKVTDINGNLVKEIDSNGSSASWDLLDLQGSPVVTGIYYFFSSTSDGEETFVGKVAVVR